ncbi:MAG: SprT family zinc-dependent metalloprotease [Pseudomonadota bacterium]
MVLSFFQKIQKRNRDFDIEINGHFLPVRVVENDRAKRLTLRIVPGGDALKVTTPCFVGDDEIEAFVERNANWAAVRLSRLPEKTKLGVNAIVPYKGEEYRIIASGKLRGLVCVNDFGNEKTIEVPGSEDMVGRKILSWFKGEARKELDLCVNRHASKIAVRPKQIRITDTTSRWGSCSSTRTLSFSWRVIMAPPEVLNYLAAHEVAHLVEMNHSERFWALTRDLCPDADKQKSWLRSNGAKLHAITI